MWAELVLPNQNTAELKSALLTTKTQPDRPFTEHISFQDNCRIAIYQWSRLRVWTWHTFFHEWKTWRFFQTRWLVIVDCLDIFLEQKPHNLFLTYQWVHSRPYRQKKPARLRTDLLLYALMTIYLRPVVCVWLQTARAVFTPTVTIDQLITQSSKCRFRP